LLRHRRLPAVDRLRIGEGSDAIAFPDGLRHAEQVAVPLAQADANSFASPHRLAYACAHSCADT
jgi:hypothetical protein